MALHAREEFEAAAALYRQAIAGEPEEARWHYLLGLALLTLKQSPAAAASFQSAVRLQPSFLPARLRLARALFESGDFSSAAGVARQLHPAEPEASYWLGRSLSALGDSAGGLENLRQASAAMPAFGAAHYSLALALRDAGDRPGSDAAFARYRAHPAAEPPPRRDDAYLDSLNRLRENTPLEQVRKGIEAESAGRLDDAVRHQRRALELDAGFAQAHINLISLYGKLARPAEAEQHYRSAVALGADQPELHHNFGVVAASRKRLSDAEAAFRSALERNPHYAEAMVNLGQVMEWQDKWQEAEPLYRDALRANPSLPLAHFQLGRWLVARGRYRDAVPHLRSATGSSAGSGNALFWFGLATALHGSGDRAQAGSAAVRARQLAAASGQTELVAAIERDFPSSGNRR
jgi:tetratricopeptide (TPR) repeat protein